MLPYYQIDTFTRDTFGGNPAGVCVLLDWLPEETLQAMAAEHNLSETAFVVIKDGQYHLRWFTPAFEVDLCGHATLATAHVLFRHLGLKQPSVKFQTRSGELTVSCDGEVLTLDLPSRPGESCEPPPGLIESLGRTPVEVSKARDYLAIFETVEEVLALQPDMAGITELDSLGVIASAPGDDCDFVSRFFAPKAGIPEDPVCGSAHCTLTPYWSRRLGKSQLHARQISSRGGELFCEAKGDRVRVGGHSVTYSTGFLHLPGL